MSNEKSCRRVRDLLARPGPTAERDETRHHLAACAECRAFAERLDAVRGALRDHHAGLRPDAQFSARVLESIRAERAADPATDPWAPLGWAALRLLPAAAVLAAIVSWTAFQPRHGFASLLLPGVGDDALVVFVASGLDDASALPRTEPGGAP